MCGENENEQLSVDEFEAAALSSFSLPSIRHRVVTTEPIRLDEGQYLTDTLIDARKSTTDHIIEIGKTRMFQKVVIDNVLVLCNRNLSQVCLKMVSSANTPVSFNTINITMAHAKIGILMDSTGGGWVNANRITVNSYNCANTVFMNGRGDNAFGMSGNLIDYVIQPTPQTEIGIVCHGKDNHFRGTFYDWHNTPETSRQLHFTPGSRRNIFQAKKPTRLLDEGKNNIYPVHYADPFPYRETQ